MSEKDKFPSELAERFQVRMPDGLRDRLREAAKANSRSMNAEIVSRLEASFGISATISEATINRIVDQTIESLIRSGWRKTDAADDDK